MLKAPPTSRQSPSPSPVFKQYATASPRSFPCTTPSAKSVSRPAQQAPEPQEWTEIDAVTRRGYRKFSSMEPPPLSSVQEKLMGGTPKTSTSISPADIPAPTSPVVEHDSPVGKRKSDDGHGTEKSEPYVEEAEEVVPKRAKSESRPSKVLPANYELCEIEDMVVLVADMITELLQTNDQLPLRTGSLTRFHSRTPPGISVVDYLQRLAKHATLTPPLLLSMVHYIDRLCSSYTAFTITSLTVHRFLITAATVASKGLSDAFWNNATYARVGGLRVEELGQLELDFLQRVDWRIVPVPETLVDYYKGLVNRSVTYRLEDAVVSSGDDMEEVLESNGSVPPAETATESQWNAWMEDVSSQLAMRDIETKSASISAE